jgi:hypothetical protein
VTRRGRDSCPPPTAKFAVTCGHLDRTDQQISAC